MGQCKISILIVLERMNLPFTIYVTVLKPSVVYKIKYRQEGITVPHRSVLLRDKFYLIQLAKCYPIRTVCTHVRKQITNPCNVIKKNSIKLYYFEYYVFFPNIRL